LDEDLFIVKPRKNRRRQRKHGGFHVPACTADRPSMSVSRLRVCHRKKQGPSTQSMMVIGLTALWAAKEAW
jgi:hypothetical protein